MAERNGYETKEHTVVSEDGYILKLFRVTSSQKGNSGKKQPVYLEHGILLDSDIWTFIGHRSLGKVAKIFNNFYCGGSQRTVLPTMDTTFGWGIKEEIPTLGGTKL
jgi:hypothetical protein